MSDSPASPSAATVENPPVTDSATGTDTPPAAVDPAEAARLKRETRKARILGKGSDRLARITNTGRGEGASAYLDASTPLSGVRPSSSTSAPIASDDDPLEVDVSQLPTISSDNFKQSHAGAFPSDNVQDQDSQQPYPPNLMEALMQQMMQGGGGLPGGPGAPPGAEGNDMGIPPQFAALMQNFGMGPGGPSGQAKGPATAIKTKGITERAFDLLQAILVLFLAVWAAKSSLFTADHTPAVPPSVSDTSSATLPAFASGTNTLHRWARLGYERPSPSEWVQSPAPSLGSLSLATLPLLPPFWIFISLEILLQSVRIVLFSNRTPAPPSMLGMLASALPIPNLQLSIRLVSKYFALANALLNDLAILVFVLGMAILWAGAQLGGAGALMPGTGMIRDEL